MISLAFTNFLFQRRDTIKFSSYGEYDTPHALLDEFQFGFTHQLIQHWKKFCCNMSNLL